MKLLAMDVGRGTQDILLYDTEDAPENALQMILPARTVILAGRIEAATRARRAVLLRGVTMGGGPITGAARRHLEAGCRLFATPQAAATFSDDPAEVAAMGVTVVEEDEAARLSTGEGTVSLETADVHLAHLRDSLKAWELDLRFEAAAVAVQDHGAAPPGESDRRYRFGWFRESLGKSPLLSDQCFRRQEVPARFTRMAGVAASLPDLERLVIMDTGFAAMLGACLDPLVGPHRTKLLVNAGNGHTLAALTEGTAVRALFEHHTRRLGAEALSTLLSALVSGEIDDRRIYEDGGHGAYRDRGRYPPSDGVGIRVMTGPRREDFVEAFPALHRAAPYGSMMQTGCWGLLAAYFSRWGGDPGRLGRQISGIAG